MSEFQLNENQKEAVSYDGNDPLIIEAGPGSGKTRVLTERVKFLLFEKNVDPESFLVITFSRKAADELKNRLAKEIKSEIINKMQISTIHSFCFELLKKYDNFSYEILDDDYAQRKTLFIQKNKGKLGFNNYHYISNSSIGSVIKKYGEYSTFKVNSSGLVDYISKNRPLSEEYKNIVDNAEDGSFPYDEIYKDENLSKDWYNARYFQIANSYQTYLDLLDKNYLVDYDTLQMKTLEFLEKDPVKDYKNILIDEFQDTNPVQYYIFEKLIPFADSFTVVGDVDQSIYGFRGALFDYFEDLQRDYGGHRVSLNQNYRSTENVVKLTEEFIKPQRDDNSIKDMKNVRKYNNDCYYMISEKDAEEPYSIFETVKSLKDKGKIEKYSDIAILFRSLKASTVKELIEIFKQEEIPYNIKNFSNLLDNDDVKSIITLLYYLLPEPFKPHIFSRFEKSWLTPKAFTGEDFEPTLWKLSDETCDVLKQLQDDFEKEAVEVAKNVYEEHTGEKTQISKFSGLFNKKNKFFQNKTSEMMEEIFKKAKRPVITLDLIENKEDKEFFQQLEDLRLRVFANVGRKMVTHLERVKNNLKNERDAHLDNQRLDFVIELGLKNELFVEMGIVDKIKEFKELLNSNNFVNDDAILAVDEIMTEIKDNDDELTILDIFYELLRITNFFDNPSEKSLNNFSVISESMYNYESVMDKTDLKGYFRFLENNVEKWEEKPVSADEGVQIMTIHKSKGLEFPIVIVPSIKQDKFPKKYEDPSKKDFIYPDYTYYTPNYLMEYKKNLKESDEYYHDLEELRILYVAMTRAQDSVILSFVGDVHPIFINIVGKGFVRPFDSDLLGKCESVFELNDDEVLNASYTSLNTFESCPYLYGLVYDSNFKISDSEAINLGSIVHDAFNKINTAKIDNPKITNDEVDTYIGDVFSSASNLTEDEEELEKYKNNIHNFYEKIGDVRILESEYSFNIMNKGYSIVGSIDLIYEDEDEIYVIDYKNTALKGNDIEKYKNQLKMYLYALSIDSKYADKNISKVGIYGVKTDNLVIDEISKEEIDDYIENVNKNIEKIKNKEFRKERQPLCDYCKFKFICN